MTCQILSYLFPPVADSLEGDSISLYSSSITVILAEMGERVGFDMCA